jgi:hypothetical protein
MIFLLFITIVGLLMSSMMHIFGVHCNSNKEVVKTDALAFWDNARVMFASNEVLSGSSYTLEQLYPKLTFSDVVFWGRLNHTVGLYEDCNENDSTGCLYYLLHGACYNCTYGDVCIAKTLFFCGQYVQICKGDAYEWTSGSIGSSAVCLQDYAKIPHNYLWNATSGQYECANLAVCGPNATGVANTQLDDLLQSMGAKSYYTDSSQKSINRVVGITCIGYAPSLAFFSFPILDFRVWVLIAVIFVMFSLLTHYGQQAKL